MPDTIDQLRASIDSLTTAIKSGNKGSGGVAGGLAAGTAAAAISGSIDTGIINNAFASLNTVFNKIIQSFDKLDDRLRQVTSHLYQMVNASGKTPRQFLEWNKGGDERYFQEVGKREVEEKKKATTGFSLLSNKMLTFGAAVAAVTRGLQGTREGYLLGYSTQHVFFEIADMLRGPIRWITNEIEGFARVVHTINTSNAMVNPTRGGLGGGSLETAKNRLTGNKSDNWVRNKAGELVPPGKENTNYRDQTWAQWFRFEGPADFSDKKRSKHRWEEVFGAAADRDRAAGNPLPPPMQKIGGTEKKPIDDHLQPLFHAEFGAIEELQNKMQALSVENPAQEHGLSLIEQIYNLLAKIYNKLPGEGHLEEIPEPAPIRKD